MRLLSLALLFPCLAGALPAGAAPLPERWVYVSTGLGSDQQADEVERVVNTAADHGLNGMLFSARFDTLDLNPPEYFTRLARIQATCKRRRVEIIPILFSAGYGGAVLAHDRNLAAGLPVVDAPFLVKGGEARIEAGPAPMTNGGFEEWAGGKLKGFQFNDGPGETTVPDRDVVKEGAVSLRLQHPDAKNGHARVMQEVAVHPYRQYRVRAWVRTQDLQPARAFMIQAHAAKGRNLVTLQPGLPATSDWRQVEMTFNSGAQEKILLYAGLWGGKSGTAWMDGLSVEEIGLYNVLRRPGTPLTVKSADGQTTYEEGKDFAPVADPDLLRPHKDPAGPPIRILPSSRIHEGDRLLVSFYHGQAVNNGQVTICMSEPKVYDIWRDQAQRLQKLLAPARWFLSMDEIRAGGSCQACKARGLTMGEILGDCITRQVQIIREVNPKAEVYCWSDMLDPNHNAHGDYYLVDGDYTGSWEHVPKDLIIACWWYEKRDVSLKFFSDRGFRTIGAAYYDGDDLENCKGWLASLQRTPKAQGIMYTTWQNKYALLPAFGDLVK